MHSWRCRAHRARTMAAFNAIKIEAVFYPLFYSGRVLEREAGLCRRSALRMRSARGTWTDV